MTMFDVPVKTKRQRKAYTNFRKELLRLGFAMLQFSVYARYYISQDKSLPSQKLIAELIPNEGAVRFLLVTDHQWSLMRVFYGKLEQKTEKPPAQLSLF